jgi:hypothetical protein
MLSASLPSMEVYDAFSLSPITVVARVLTSHPTSASLRVENFQRDGLGYFSRFERLASLDAWLAQIFDMRLVAVRDGRC